MSGWHDEPATLESMDTDHVVQASSEHTPMEVDSTTVVAQQCSDGGEDVQFRGPAIHISSVGKYYALYDKGITNYLKDKFSNQSKYEVREPIGYALLMSCKGPTNSDILNPLPSSAVYKDVEHMKIALNKTGGWKTLLICNRMLDGELMHQKLKCLKGEGLENFSVFLLFFSGHGNHNGVILDDNRTFYYSDIVKLASIDSLKNKPKIFIFDCCRSRHEEQKYSLNQVLNSCSEYPPPHTLICYSATDHCSSGLDDHQGSFYTLSLTHAIRQFGERLSFLEIITLVNGFTQAVAKYCVEEYGKNDGKVDKDQRPVFTSNLDKLLVLSARSCEEDKAETDTIMGVSESIQESKHRIGTAELVYKGLGTKGHLQEGERDIIHLTKDVEVKSEWNSKDKIKANLGSLGDGISIFFIYAPNPDDPYKQVSSQDPLEQRNRYFMCRLFLDLERLGFHVLSDIHLGDTEPANWLQWYITRILQCNFVIFVCSPAFKELFQDTPRVDKIVNDKARKLLEYRNAMYAGVSRELLSGRRKFLPVILDNYEDSECVPALFESGKIYRIKHENVQRRFNYDDRSRDFEKLVCYMAGIDRAKLDQPAVGEVKILGDPFRIRDMELMVKEEEERRLLERPRGLLTADEIRSPSNLARQPTTNYSQSIVGGANTSVNPGGIPSSHQEASIGLSPFIPQPQIQAPPRPSTSEVPSSLPLKVPSRKIYLWLSSKIVMWKFVARHLGLQEADIERIQTDHRGLDERRYQMFLTWEQHCYPECNYQKLGEVLMNSEKNRGLYDEYVRRVKENELIR